MFPKINNKSLLDCTEEDLQILIDNPDFRENEYLDYKKAFAHLELQNERKNVIEAKKAELKSDICSFANAEGGYLIYGISDEKGCAKEIVGIQIENDNTDQFELKIRNILNTIIPKSPYTKFNFIKLKDGRFVVVIYIKHDNYSPYTQVIDDKGYIMYTRSGNGKRLMTFTEVKNLFNHSLELDKEITIFRNERVNFYNATENISRVDESQNRFVLLHIIPETFLDSSYNRNVFMLEKNHEFSSYPIFEAFCCTNRSVPCVDGLRCCGITSYYSRYECRINNNGIVECFAPLSNYLYSISPNDDDRLDHNELWKSIEKVLDAYRSSIMKINTDERVFWCITICGAKGVIGEKRDYGIGYIGNIDRNLLLCSPTVCEHLEDDQAFDIAKKNLHIEFLLSLGVKYNEMLNQLIDEVYEKINVDTDTK